MTSSADGLGGGTYILLTELLPLLLSRVQEPGDGQCFQPLLLHPLCHEQAADCVSQGVKIVVATILGRQATCTNVIYTVVYRLIIHSPLYPVKLVFPSPSLAFLPLLLPTSTSSEAVVNHVGGARLDGTDYMTSPRKKPRKQNLYVGSFWL